MSPWIKNMYNYISIKSGKASTTTKSPDRGTVIATTYTPAFCLSSQLLALELTS